MAEDFRLSAEKRELLGSANTRRLRKQGARTGKSVWIPKGLSERQHFG